MLRHFLRICFQSSKKTLLYVLKNISIIFCIKVSKKAELSADFKSV